MAEEKNSKYKGLKPEIAAEIEMDEIRYFREDKPIPFCGLMIYPATVRDYESFCNCSTCFTLNRKTSPQGLRMTNLEYLLLHMQKEGKEGQEWSYKVQKLFEIIFHIENGIKCLNPECNNHINYASVEFLDYIAKVKDAQNKNEPIPTFKCPKCGGTEIEEVIKYVQNPDTKKYELIIDGHKIVSKDFDRLRQIVLFQNFPDYRDDSWVDPKLKADFEAKLEIQRKKNDTSASIERKVVGVAINTNFKFNEIFDMSIRKFTLVLSMVDDLINYKIMQQATMSGFVSLPKDQKVEHWLYKPEKDMYGDAYKDVDSLKKQVGNL